MLGGPHQLPRQVRLVLALLLAHALVNVACRPPSNRPTSAPVQRSTSTEKKPSLPRACVATLRQGQIRVSLLSITKAIAFVHDRENLPLEVEAEVLPLVQLAILVECLGDTPIIHANWGPITFADANGNPIPGSLSFSEYEFIDFDRRSKDGIIRVPAVKNASRAEVVRYTFKGEIHELERVNITLETGFNDGVAEFRFFDVPLPP